MKGKTFPLLKAYPFAREHGLDTQIEEIRNLRIKWHLSYTSSVRRGRLIALLRERGLLDQFIERSWPLGKTIVGRGEITRCEQAAKKFDTR